MYVARALILAFVVANYQSVRSAPIVHGHSVVQHFLDGFLGPLLIPLRSVPIDGKILSIVERTQGAMVEALDQDQITLDQAKEVIAEVLDAAAENELSPLTEVDIALEEAVKEEVIDTETKVKILLAGIRAGHHIDAPETLEETIEAFIDAAVHANVIDEDIADEILDVVPDEVEPDPFAIVTADDVDAAVEDEDIPVGVKNEIREIASKAEDTMHEAADKGLLTDFEAEDVIDVVWEAAKENELSELSEVDIALNTLVEDDIIDEITKINILLNAIKARLYIDPPLPLSNTIAAVVDAAVEADIIDEDIGEEIKEEAPDAVEPDVDATIGGEDIDEAAECS